MGRLSKPLEKGRRTKVAIAGLGTVGRAVASRMEELEDDYVLTAVAARRTARARAFLAEHSADDVEVKPLADLVTHADLVIECLPPELFVEIAVPVLEAGKSLVALSAGALLNSWHIVDLARETGGSILVPTGALLGLDGVQAAAQGTVSSVRMITRKPIEGLRGAPYLLARGIDIDGLRRPRRVFHGTAREAVDGFPANLNVAVALALAGVGPDRTEIEIWADPQLKQNTHNIQVRSDSADLDFSIQNIPSENPKTGRLTALSVLALLHKLASPLRVGT